MIFLAKMELSCERISSVRPLHNLAANLRLLLGKPGDASFGSMRVFELTTRRMWQILQRIMKNKVVKPVYRAWLRHSFAPGGSLRQRGSSLNVTAYSQAMRSDFRGAPFPWLDPRAQVAENDFLLKSYGKTPFDIARDQGSDLDETFYRGAGLSLEQVSQMGGTPIDF